MQPLLVLELQRMGKEEVAIVLVTQLSDKKEEEKTASSLLKRGHCPMYGLSLELRMGCCALEK